MTLGSLFDLMPTHPATRREAEGYLHVFSGIMVILTTLEVLINIGFSPIRTWWEPWVFFPQVPIALFAYFNARRDYRWMSASAQIMMFLVLIGGFVTAMAHFYGSTSGPHPGPGAPPTPRVEPRVAGKGSRGQL